MVTLIKRQIGVGAQGVKKKCRLSLLTNSALVIRVQMRGEGGVAGVSANEYSCAYHMTWSPNKLWRSNSIFNLCGSQSISIVTMTTLYVRVVIFYFLNVFFHYLGEAQSPVCSGAGGPVSQCPPGCKCIEGIVDCRQVYTVKKG